MSRTLAEPIHERSRQCVRRKLSRIYYSKTARAEGLIRKGNIADEAEAFFHAHGEDEGNVSGNVTCRAVFAFIESKVDMYHLGRAARVSQEEHGIKRDA